MKALLDKIAQLRVLVIGDIILDHYIWGDASRISPEAPVPVVAVDRDTYTAGGAANVAFNLKALGCRTTTLCGVIGQDMAADKLKELLREQEISFDMVSAKGGLSTILKTRIIVRHQQLCRLDRELAPSAYAIDLERHLGDMKKKMEEVDAVILSDYAKGVITEPLVETVQAVTQEKGILSAYDPKPKRRFQPHGFDLITPNRKESLELAGMELDPHDPYPSAEVCARIWERYKPKHLVITLGDAGMLLSESGTVGQSIPTYAREVFDVSGAGDTVIAALAVALATGAPMKEAAHFANTAAGVVVSKLGTATATPEEILSYEATHE